MARPVTRSSPADGAGGRRRAGLHEVPVVVIEATDAEALQLAIIENVQRANLNPLEEAEGYRSLMDEFSNSQEDVARMVGKSRSYVANTLRLLRLPEPVKAHINSGKLDAGHARMLVGDANAEALAEEIVARNLNVRQVEAMARVRAHKNGKTKGSGTRFAQKSADTLMLEKRVSDALGLSVRIEQRRGGGMLSIKYRSLDQLEDVLRRLDKQH